VTSPKNPGPRSLSVDVLERSNTRLVGKSYALAYAHAAIARRASPPDGVVVVDADTLVDATFFRVIGEDLARGVQAIQVYYRAGTGDTELVRLRRLALLLVHRARPLGYGRLGIGSGLKGNGMAFSWGASAVAMAPGRGLTEDAAATLALAANGIPVLFEPRTSVAGFMAPGYQNARTQDSRWETGRHLLIPSALATAFRLVLRGNWRQAIPCLEVASLPLSLLIVLAGLGAAPPIVGIGSPALALLASGSLVSYVTLGLGAGRPCREDLKALRTAPWFLAHKLRIHAGIVVRRPSGVWQRTSRG